MTVSSSSLAPSSSESRRPSVLVTGANGFMGSHMLDVLVRTKLMGDIRLLATDIAPEPSKHTLATIGYAAFAGKSVHVTYAPCDITNRDEVDRFVADHGPFDVAFHIAGLFSYSASSEALQAVNVRGTENVVSALAQQSPKPGHVVVWGAGGSYDFSSVPATGVNELHPKAPSAPYFESKLDAERIALNIGHLRGMPLTVLRPGGVYGPRSAYGVAVAIKVAARGGLGPQYIGPRTTRAGMIHAEDVCRAAVFTVAFSSRTRDRIFNVNDDGCIIEGRAYTTYELFRAAAKRLGYPLWMPGSAPMAVMRTLVRVLDRVARRAGRVPLLNEDLVKLQEYDALLDAGELKKLGWAPLHRDSLKGLLKTIDEMEKGGEL